MCPIKTSLTVWFIGVIRFEKNKTIRKLPNNQRNCEENSINRHSHYSDLVTTIIRLYKVALGICHWKGRDLSISTWVYWATSKFIFKTLLLLLNIVISCSWDQGQHLVSQFCQQRKQIILMEKHNPCTFRPFTSVFPQCCKNRWLISHDDSPHVSIHHSPSIRRAFCEPCVCPSILHTFCVYHCRRMLSLQMVPE